MAWLAMKAQEKGIGFSFWRVEANECMRMSSSLWPMLVSGYETAAIQLSYAAAADLAFSPHFTRAITSPAQQCTTQHFPFWKWCLTLIRFCLPTPAPIPLPALPLPCPAMHNRVFSIMSDTNSFWPLPAPAPNPTPACTAPAQHNPAFSNRH